MLGALRLNESLHFGILFDGKVDGWGQLAGISCLLGFSVLATRPDKDLFREVRARRPQERSLGASVVTLKSALCGWGDGEDFLPLATLREDAERSSALEVDARFLRLGLCIDSLSKLSFVALSMLLVDAFNLLSRKLLVPFSCSVELKLACDPERRSAVTVLRSICKPRWGH